MVSLTVLTYFSEEVTNMTRLDVRTYIYRKDGKCMHRNAAGGFMGGEYEHDDPNWQPPKDWPYESKDMREKKEGN